MSVATRESGSTTEQIRREIQAAVMKQLQQEGTEAELAEHLGMLPAGVAVLRRRTQWSLEEALRIADRLGLQVRVQVLPNENRG